MRIVKNLLIALLSILIISCNHPGNKSTSIKKDTTEVKINKKLSLEEQAKNTYMNTTSIISGIMILSLSDMFQGTIKSFAVSATGNLDSVDAIINNMDQGLSAQLDTMVTSMNKVFNDILTKNISIYKKLFSKEVLKNGVAIATKYEVPKGFRPLTQDLSPQEIKQYIIYTLSIPKDEDSTNVVGKTLSELAQWLQDVDAEIKADPEISNFLNTLQ